MSIYFEHKGIQVTTAETPAEAMRCAENTGFSAAIFDFYMEGGDGAEAVERFKERHPDIPVVMFTAWAEDEEKMGAAISKGAAAIFSKGEPLSVLLAGTLRLIGRGK